MALRTRHRRRKADPEAEIRERDLAYVDFGVVGKESDRFRARARNCRHVAAQTKDAEWRQKLLSPAQDLEDEADTIDDDEGTKLFAAQLPAAFRQ